MADNTYLNALAKVLRDRDIPYNRDELKSICDDSEYQAKIRAFVDEYLSPETLLTKEELNLYATLEKNGEVTKLATSKDLSSIRGLDDHEIEAAVEELKRSTFAIEKQTEALKAQQKALSSLVKSNARSDQARSQAERYHGRKWNIEKGQIGAVVEELSQSLKYQTTDLEQQAKSAESGIKQTVENILRSDDKLLLSLEKLAGDLEPQHENDGLIDRIRELCARLIKHTVEGIRTRLDRIYLDALGNSKGDGIEDSQEIVDLREELESLYSEVLPVAQMSAEQQFLEPALREIAAENGHGQERSVQAFKYINRCLNFLINRIEVYLERAEEYRSHQMASQYMLSEAKKELQSPDQTMTASSIQPNIQKRRDSTGSKSPEQARHRRRSSAHQEGETEPEKHLLRHLGLSAPALGATNQTQVEAFERALSDRLKKVQIHAANLQSTTESSITSHLMDAHSTLQLLQDSLMAETLYGKIQLVDPDIEASIDIFEDEINSLREELEAINLQKLHERNVHRDLLVERWSR